MGPYLSGMPTEGMGGGASAGAAGAQATAVPAVAPGSNTGRAPGGSGRGAARCRVPGCTQRLLQAYNQVGWAAVPMPMHPCLLAQCLRSAWGPGAWQRGGAGLRLAPRHSHSGLT